MSANRSLLVTLTDVYTCILSSTCSLFPVHPLVTAKSYPSLKLIPKSLSSGSYAVLMQSLLVFLEPPHVYFDITALSCLFHSVLHYDCLFSPFFTSNLLFPPAKATCLRAYSSGLFLFPSIRKFWPMLSALFIYSCSNEDNGIFLLVS